MSTYSYAPTHSLRVNKILDRGRLLPQRDPLLLRHAQALPHRVPGAALKDNPPPANFEWHVTQPKPTRMQRVIAFFRARLVLPERTKAWIERVKAWPLCTEAEFTAAWQKSEEIARKESYKPRHAQDHAWRTRWAAYDTQAWPFLGTTNPAIEWLQDWNWPDPTIRTTVI